MVSFDDLKARIVIDSAIHFGKPCVARTRIPVQDVLELVQEGISFDDIIRNYYPDLTSEDIKACARYATELVRSKEIHIAPLNAISAAQLQEESRRQLEERY